MVSVIAERLAGDWEDMRKEDGDGDLLDLFSGCTEANASVTPTTTTSSSGDNPCDSVILSNKKKRKRYEMSEEAKERRRKLRRVRFPLPKIPKHDLRRQFGCMLANIFNSYDISLFQGFFKTFCINTCVLDDNIPENMLFNLPQRVQAIGVDAFTIYFSESIQCTPDAVFQLEDIQLRVVDLLIPKQKQTLQKITTHAEEGQEDEEDFDRQHSHSILSAQMKYSGMMMYQPVQSFHPLDQVRIINPQDCLHMDQFFTYMQLLEQPLAFHVTGKMYIHINNMMQITKMEFRGSGVE
jgi:hypothetical protein